MSGVAPTYLTIGGFLGAGKTTASLRLAEGLTARGLRVGIITNDQSRGLVDTATVESHGYPVREITDGCFCCRFPSLIEAAESLTRDVRPDVFLAEPVGSCTDLRATVQIPLQRLYGDAYRVAPLSVMVDPLRAARALDIDCGPSFSERVLYVYGKQLEEADILVLNKIDILEAELRDRLQRELERRYPCAEVRAISARTGLGVEDWIDRLLATAASSIERRAAMEVDYDLYAAGEALLGWSNATFRLDAPHPFDGNLVLSRLARDLAGGMEAGDVEIAHLKMTLVGDGGEDRATLNLVATAGSAELARRLERPIASGELIVNLRAETDPERLHNAVLKALSSVCGDLGVTASLDREAHFRPGRPVPTHRMVEFPA